MLKEFKEFAIKGNVIDMAVGIIIGAAFGGVVNSLVKDIFMPPIGKILGGVDFSNIFIALDGNKYATLAEAQAHTATISIGLFVNVLISFIITAFAIFMLIKAVNAMKKKEAEAPTTSLPPPPEEVLLREIRDLLAKR